MGSLLLLFTSLLGLTPPGQQPPNPIGWVADANDKAWPNTPPDWEVGEFAPGTLGSLALGSPAVLKQPQATLAAPFFQLPSMGLLRGDSAFIQDLNTVVFQWHRQERQKAFEGFLKLEAGWKKLPNQLPEVTVARLLKGFFHTEMAVDRESTLKEGQGEWTPLLHQRRAQAHFWEVLQESDIVALLKPMPLMKPLYGGNHLTQWPVYKVGKEWRGNPKPPPVLAPQPLDTPAYLRSILPLGLWNAFVLEASTKRWGRAFDAADALGELLPSFLSVPETSPVPRPVDPLGVLPARVEVWPRSFRDMDALRQIVLGTAHVENQDLGSAVRSFHNAVLTSQTPSLRSLGALSIGQVFSNLGDLRLALRAYAWAEALAPQEHPLLEPILFWGSEIAFWMGRRPLAEQGFRRFTDLFGTPTLSPWVKLRLAEMDHRSGQMANALMAYERIARTHVGHPAALEAQVRVYCLDALNTSPKLQDHLWNALESSLKSSRFALQQQAKTCRMRSNLKNTVEKTKGLPESFASRAKRQWELIETFTQEFPQTPLTPQLEAQKKALSVAETADLAQKAQCRPLLSAYETHKATLDQLGNQGEQFLAGLKWGVEQKQTLGRCAALYGLTPLWLALREQGTRFDSGLWQDLVLETKTSQKPLERYHKMLHHLTEQPLERVLAAAKRFENPTDLLKQQDFWFLFASYQLLSLSQTEGSTPTFQAFLKPWLLADVPRTLAHPLLCQWFVPLSGTLTAPQWDKVAQAFAPAVWLDWWQMDKTPTQCVELVTLRLLTASSGPMPSPVRDKAIVEPFLTKAGPKAMPEDWLAFLQRQEKKLGPHTSKIRQWYAELEKETDNEIVKEAARLWRERYVEPTKNMW